MITCPRCKTEEVILPWPDTNKLWQCYNKLCGTRFTLNEKNEPTIVDVGMAESFGEAFGLESGGITIACNLTPKDGLQVWVANN